MKQERLETCFACSRLALCTHKCDFSVKKAEKERMIIAQLECFEHLDWPSRAQRFSFSRPSTLCSFICLGLEKKDRDKTSSFLFTKTEKTS